MANVYGSNYSKEYIQDPKQAANVGEVAGKVRVIYDEFSGASGSDDVYFGKLQAGALILSVNEIGGGTAASFNVAVGDKLTAETDLICSLDADADAAGQCWIEYALD
jgi:hypothetical protein